MEAPTAEEQLAFLAKLQRLMTDGQFVATYKYALLLAIADLAVESGDSSGGTLTLSTRLIADKFIQFYWRQTVPYVFRPDAIDPALLRQNTGRTAEVISLVLAARRQFDGSLADAKRDRREWNKLLTAIDAVVRKMPLWKLQTIGSTTTDFLYENVGRGRTIELRPGVAYSLRQFHPLISELVRSAWTRYVRRNNHDALGTTSDLSEFLFGCERRSLSAVREILEDLQDGTCFYCARSLPPRTGQVDHFIPWTRYPSDLGHNFVLAHASCNNAKSDHLAAERFLQAWTQRNSHHHEYLAVNFGKCGIVHDLPTSVRLTAWAYQQLSQIGGSTWKPPSVFEALSGQWRELLFQQDLQN